MPEVLEDDAMISWIRATHRYKETWLRSRGFFLNYAKIPNYRDLPEHVRHRWEFELTD